MAGAISDAHATHVPRLIAYVSAQQAGLWLQQGDTIAANDWADTQQLTIDDALTYLREFEYVTFARVLLARGLHTEALYLLKRIQINAVADGRNNHVIAVLIVIALAHRAQGDDAQAQDAIDQAFRLAVSGRYLRSFIDAGPPLVPLLIEARNRLDCLPQTVAEPALCLYLDTILSACHEVEQAENMSEQPNRAPLARMDIDGPTSTLQGSSAGVVELYRGQQQLSPRDMDLLDCLAFGMSNKEIALHLGLTVGTVKWYLTHMYDKLGVGTRTQALVRARSTGLIREPKKVGT